MSNYTEDYQEFINKFGKNKKVNEEDKDNFFGKILDKIGLNNAKTLFHIATHPKCAKTIFTPVDLSLIIGAVAYVIIPFDAIPDILPIGLIDDIVVVSGILSKCSELLKQYENQCM